MSKDGIFAVVTAIFFWSLWQVLSLEPVTWLPIAGLYITGSLLLVSYKSLMEDKDDRD